MNKKIIRILASATLAGVLAVSVATPAECAVVLGTTPILSINNGNELGVDIGNMNPTTVKIGGDIISVRSIDNNIYCSKENEWTATGTYATGSQLPYSKVLTAGPYTRQALTEFATALGYKTGNAFEIEIGQFTNYSGYKPCAKLNNSMHYEVYAIPAAGYIPAMMALLPNGAIVMLDDNEFNRRSFNPLAGAAPQIFYLNTIFPKAVYMMVYVPVK